MKGKEQMLAALNEFIGNEKDGYEFYQWCASRTADQRGKEMFRSLAADELEHIRKLQTEYDSLAGEGGWVSLEALGKGRKAKKQPIFPASQRRVREMIAPNATDLDALQVAIGMEKESYSAYDGQRKKASDPAVSGVFSRLAEEEHQHLETLENTYNYLANTGDWFQAMEKPIFEG